MAIALSKSSLVLILAVSLGGIGGATGSLRADEPPTPPSEKPSDEKPPEGGDAKPPEEGEKPGVDAEQIKTFCKDLEDKMSKMTNEDLIQHVDRIVEYWKTPGLEEGARKPLLATMSKFAKLKRKEAVVEATAKGLGEFGEEGVNLLKFIVDSAIGQKDAPSSIIGAGLKSLGKIASTKPGDVKFLTDLLKKEDEIIGRAADALALYAKAPGAIRKEMFEELLKISEGVASGADNGDAALKKRWNIWGDDVVIAMQKLTRQAFGKPAEFRRWLQSKEVGGGKHAKTWADPEPQK